MTRKAVSVQFPADGLLALLLYITILALPEKRRKREKEEGRNVNWGERILINGTLVKLVNRF